MREASVRSVRKTVEKRQHFLLRWLLDPALSIGLRTRSQASAVIGYHILDAFEQKVVEPER